MATVPRLRDCGLVDAAPSWLQRTESAPLLAPVPRTRSSQPGVGCPGWLEDTECLAGAERRRLPILTGRAQAARARGLPRVRAAPSRLRLVLQRLRSGAESCGGVLRGPTDLQYGRPTDVAGTLGSLVAAPGLMIVQKVAIKSLGGGERAEKHSSADPGTKES